MKVNFKNFSNKYEKKLSAIAKLILNSFQNKYLYYAIDDIYIHLNQIEVNEIIF
jgi:hypothetical protein